MFSFVINKWHSGETAFIHCVQCGFIFLGLLKLSGKLERQPSYVVFRVRFLCLVLL